MNNGLSGIKFDNLYNFDQLLFYNEIHYLTDGLNSLKNLESNSIDFLFSNATLEHIVFDQFIDTNKEISRIIKPNGLISHRVDLRDHLGGGLNNLRFSKKIWESDFFSKSGFYTNRIRYSQMLDIFEKTGFSLEVSIIETWDKLPIDKLKISPDFKEISDEDLCVSVFDVLLKPK